MRRLVVLSALTSLGATALAQEATEPDDDDVYTVTVTHDPRDVDDVPASVTVLTGEQLRSVPTADLTDAMRMVPGVTLTAGSQGRREITLRGMDSRYTLILVDGRRVSSSESVFRHNDFDISMIPLEAVERIEVVRGAMSSVYGSDALGGVVHIITRPVDDQWTAGATLQGQTPLSGRGGQEARLSLLTGGPLIQDRVGLRILGNVGLRGIYNGAVTPEDPVLDGDGAPVTRDDGTVLLQGDLASLEGQSNHSVRTTLTLTPTENDRIALDGTVGYQHRRGEYYIRSYGNADASVLRTTAALSWDAKRDWGTAFSQVYWEGTDTGVDGTHQDNLVGETRVSAMVGPHVLQVGGDVRYTNLSAPDTFADGNATVHQEGLYTQANLSLLPQLDATVGARLDHHQNFGLWGTPRGYLVWTPSPDWTIKGGVGTGYKSPSLRNLAPGSRTTSCRGACLIVGNPDLQPEASTNSEVSVRFEPGPIGLFATAYRNDVRNLLQTPRGDGVDPVGIDHETGLPMFVPVNISRARLQGFELGAQARVGELVNTRVSLDLLHARDLDADAAIDYRPRHRGTAQLDLTPGDIASIFVRGELIGPQSAGETDIEAYGLVDAGFSIEPSEQFAVRAGLLNLTGTKTTGDAGYAYQERPRTAFVSVSARR